MGDANAGDWSRPPAKWFTELTRFVFSPHCRDLAVIAGTAPFVELLFVTSFPRLSDSEAVAALTAGTLAVVAWAFQSANLRFGVADIFAAEISTLCRIFAVGDFIQRLIDQYETKGRIARPARPNQDYVVIFHNNSKDLEVLDGSAVSWVTEFYVYFKALIDAMSRLPEVAEDGRHSAEAAKAAQEASFDVLFTAFLMFESGREALMRLVDDQHHRQESVLTALASEVTAYAFLHKAFETKPLDIRKRRIEARLPEYRPLIERVRSIAAASPGPRVSAVKIHALAEEVVNRWREGGLDRAPPP